MRRGFALLVLFIFYIKGEVREPCTIIFYIKGEVREPCTIIFYIKGEVRELWITYVVFDDGSEHVLHLVVLLRQLCHVLPHLIHLCQQ